MSDRPGDDTPPIQQVLAAYVANCRTPLLHPDALRCLYIRTMQERHGNISKTAKLLGLHRRTLQRMLLKNPDRRRGEACERVCGECSASREET